MPPNAPPFASGDAGDPAGLAPRRVRLEVRGLHPTGDEPDPARGQRRQLQRPREVGGGAPPLHLRRDRPAPRAATRPRPTARRPPRSTTPRSPGGSGTATSASRGARSSAKPPSPSGISGPTRCGTPPSSSARRAAPRGRRPTAEARRRSRRRSPRRPSPSRCSGTGGRRAPGRGRSAGSRPFARRAAARTTIPGVQKPHCDPPWSTNPATSASRRVGVEAFDRRDRAPGHPGHRGHAGDARVPVDEHRAAPALPLRRAAVLRRDDAEPLAEHREERLAGKRVDDDRCAVARERDPIPSSGHGEAG